MCESTAVFEARALEIGVSQDDLDKLKEKGVATFGQYAFICPFAPGSTDEKLLTDALTDILQKAVEAAEMIAFRRLYYESHAVATSDMKTRLERTATDTPRQMPLAERMLRLKRQREELKGIVFDATTEPSHGLVDKVQAMQEEGILSHLPPNKCPSREHEVAKDKQDNVISFTQDGSLRIAKKATDLSCEANGEVKIRSALTRRALAFDQVGLMSFIEQEEWHAKMFHALQREPPAGHRYITMQQVLAADKQLWTLLSQESRNSLQIQPGSPPPLDKLMKTLINDTQVTSCMTHLPSGSSSSSGGQNLTQQPKQQAASPSAPPPPKPYTSPSAPKGGGKSTDSIAYYLKNMPPNCVSKMDNGKFLCLRFQHGKCPQQKKKQCRNGLHNCYYKGCHKPRPYCECSH